MPGATADADGMARQSWNERDTLQVIFVQTSLAGPRGYINRGVANDADFFQSLSRMRSQSGGGLINSRRICDSARCLTSSLAGYTLRLRAPRRRGGQMWPPIADAKCFMIMLHGSCLRWGRFRFPFLAIGGARNDVTVRTIGRDPYAEPGSSRDRARLQTLSAGNKGSSASGCEERVRELQILNATLTADTCRRPSHQPAQDQARLPTQPSLRALCARHPGTRSTPSEFHSSWIAHEFFLVRTTPLAA